MSEDGWEAEGFWNSLVRLKLFAGVVEGVDVDVAVVISRGECLDGAADGPDFSFIRDGVVGVVAGRDPNDLTLSFLTTGVAVGDDETGAEASSIKPNFKEDPERSVNVW